MSKDRRRFDKLSAPVGVRGILSLLKDERRFDKLSTPVGAVGIHIPPNQRPASNQRRVSGNRRAGLRQHCKISLRREGCIFLLKRENLRAFRQPGDRLAQRRPFLAQRLA